MQPESVVENLNVLKDFQPCFCACFIAMMVHQLGLQRLKETLCGSVVPAVALATHGADDAILPQQLLIIVTCILAAAVGVGDQPPARMTVGNSHLHSLDDQVPGA